MSSMLRSRRIEKGYSQLDLYRKTEIGPWRISQFERGLIPHREEAEKIAGVLGTPILVLFPTLTQETRG